MSETYMSWFKRKEKGIQTPTKEKKEAPNGLWYKTPKGHIVHMRDMEKNAYVCPADGHHMRIGSKEYFALLFDDNSFEELDAHIRSADPLQFVDTKAYTERVRTAIAKTHLNDAVRCAKGAMGAQDIVIACMDFTFIGGSMGAVVGEKISRAAQRAYDDHLPFLVICKSGGARMMEAGYSLMQMPKILSKLLLLADAKLPYIALLTNPTTGGVSASFGMLGDMNLAEPEALIGFAGPRVIRETIGQDLPKGFQHAEFLLKHGFVDAIVDRRQLKETLVLLLSMLSHGDGSLQKHEPATQRRASSAKKKIL